MCNTSLSICLKITFIGVVDYLEQTTKGIESYTDTSVRWDRLAPETMQLFIDLESASRKETVINKLTQYFIDRANLPEDQVSKTEFLLQNANGTPVINKIKNTIDCGFLIITTETAQRFKIDQNYPDCNAH